MTEKVYLSCIESTIEATEADAVTQAIQHLTITTFAKSIDGRITFYTGEDFLTRASQSLMRSTLRKRLPIDGVIFYRLKQFCHGGNLNFGFMQTILDDGYELHFAREAFSIHTRIDLDRQFTELFCYDIMLKSRSSFELALA